MRCVPCRVLLFALQCTAVLASKHRRPGFTSAKTHLPTLSWALHLENQDDTGDLDQIAADLASSLGLVSEGQIGSLPGHYQLSHPQHLHYHRKKSVLTAHHHITSSPSIEWPVETIDSHSWEEIISQIHNALDDHPCVVSFTQQTVRTRQKRGAVHTRRKRGVTFTDPEYKHQWHLVGTTD